MQFPSSQNQKSELRWGTVYLEYFRHDTYWDLMLLTLVIPLPSYSPALGNVRCSAINGGHCPPNLLILSYYLLRRKSFSFFLFWWFASQWLFCRQNASISDLNYVTFVCDWFTHTNVFITEEICKHIVLNLSALRIVMLAFTELWLCNRHCWILYLSCLTNSHHSVPTEQMWGWSSESPETGPQPHR